LEGRARSRETRCDGLPCFALNDRRPSWTTTHASAG
jgi:hypothetical protein